MASGQDASESEESGLNVNVLKEIARKDLVDALNSVSDNSDWEFVILTVMIRLAGPKRSSLTRH